VALALLTHLGGPLTGTSANRSGEEDPRDATEVLRQLGSRVDLILDGGPAAIGRPSTVVDATVSPPVIVRAGAIRHDEIFRLLTIQRRVKKANDGTSEASKPFGKAGKM
jgi:L-threonylcarbamoyladenylate synthase